MKKGAKDILLNSFELILKKPILIGPFLVLAFFEGLALEIAYFSPQKPLSFIFGPIIKKFFGTPFTHYPGGLLVLPKLFYYMQLVVYALIGVFLFAVAINILKNIKSDLTIKTNALIRNALKKYKYYLGYGVLMIALITLLAKFDMFLLYKFFNLTGSEFPNATRTMAPFVTPIFLFLNTVLLQVFFILVIPIMVIQEKPFFKALLGSLSLGFRHFLALFVIIFFPYLLYFPVSLIKHFSLKIAGLTIPEASAIVVAVGIIASIPINCFVTVCVSNFLLELKKK